MGTWSLAQCLMPNGWSVQNVCFGISDWMIHASCRAWTWQRQDIVMKGNKNQLVIWRKALAERVRKDLDSSLKFYFLKVAKELGDLATEGLWWLILCVDFSGPRDARMFDQTLFWVCLWGCFGWASHVNHESPDWVKQMASFMWVGLTQSVDGLDRPKTLSLPWVRGNSSCLTAWARSLFFLFRFKLNYQLFLAFGLELYRQLSWVSSLLTADLGTSQDL